MRAPAVSYATSRSAGLYRTVSKGR